MSVDQSPASAEQPEASSGAPASRGLGWEEALTELEARVLGAEAVLRQGGYSELDPWVAPRLTEPLPAHLVERARGLLERHRDLCDQLDTALTGLRRQLTVADRVRQATGRRSGPVYVDVSA
jgi:hypothetical protein